MKSRVLGIINSTMIKPNDIKKSFEAEKAKETKKAQKKKEAAEASAAVLSAAEDVVHKENYYDGEMGRIIADMEAAEAEQKARKKEKKAAEMAAKAAAEPVNAKEELKCAERIVKELGEAKFKGSDSADGELYAQLKKNTQFGPSAGATKSGTPTLHSESPAPPVRSPSIAAPATGSYCGRCKQEFRDAIHLQTHIEISVAHHLCDVCKEDTNTWKGLLLHHKTTGHAIVCQECCQGNGDAFPADGIAYRSHLNIQNVCKTCNVHCGSSVALEEVP